jgi:hypothetical protein
MRRAATCDVTGLVHFIDIAAYHTTSKLLICSGLESFPVVLEYACLFCFSPLSPL